MFINLIVLKKNVSFFIFNFLNIASKLFEKVFLSQKKYNGKTDVVKYFQLYSNQWKKNPAIQNKISKNKS